MARNGELSAVDGRNVLHFERELAHPVAKVWRAITDPEHSKQWFPAAMHTELKQGATILFVFEGDDGAPTKGTITDFEPPHLFAFTWEGEALRWELRENGDGCVLVFTHAFDDRAGAASFATGWEGCLTALEQLLDGQEITEAAPYGPRHDEYVALFGLARGELLETEDGWTVRFERNLTKSQTEVWALLIDSAPEVGAEPPLRFTTGYVEVGPITAVQERELLEYSWQGGVIRWELRQGNGGARLVLTQTGTSAQADQRTTALGAWHVHIDLLAQWLRGETPCWPEGRVEALAAEYAQEYTEQLNLG
ncbi:SRPBCC family protein [Allokutzneria sp. NRRL B-24872]|uniref:SRPBCC family protein n=1 Tax=Allokutzneria sp. NRRL B-24872 TaxID=1137961 RepID=UPI000A39A888|nr:SRPBCC family protein [Allokutzneria sp. NRRL B-24872]